MSAAWRALASELAAAATAAAIVVWLLLRLLREEAKPPADVTPHPRQGAISDARSHVVDEHASITAATPIQNDMPSPPPPPPPLPPLAQHDLRPAAGGHRERGSPGPTTARSFPSDEGSWNCSNPVVWVDELEQRTTSAVLDVPRVVDELRFRWVVLVGDSSVRMLYHMLLGIYSQGWKRWPIAENKLIAGSCLESRIDASGGDAPGCIEDTILPGFRATCVWSDFGDAASLSPLFDVANATLGAPDLVLVGIGAWWAWHRASEGAAYAQSVRSVLRGLDGAFLRRPDAVLVGELRQPPPLRVWAATTTCDRDGDNGAFSVYKLNGLARDAVHKAGWEYFNREVRCVSRLCRALTQPKAVARTGSLFPRFPRRRAPLASHVAGCHKQRLRTR